MHSAPHDAGPRIVFVLFRGGEEVVVVKRDAPVTLAEVASLPVVLGPVQAGRMLGLEPPAASTTTTSGCGCGARVNAEEKARTVDGST